MLEKKNCFNCNNARPVEIQCTTCICKAGKGKKILDDYWVDDIITIWDYIALTLGIEGDQTQIEEQILRKIS